VNVGSLFSGIGGLDHGLHRAGHRHLFFCESDPYRRAILAARWPGVPVYEDVREVATGGRGRPEPGVVGREFSGSDSGRGRAWAENGDARSDLLCGGFPCQDLSVAGQRRGLAGSRSGLFHEFARVADALRPRWLLVENVPGLLSSNGGRDFGVVLGTLADIGYGVGWRVLDSRYFGVPQRRRRVFILGALAVGDPRAAAERCGQVLAVGTRCDRHPATRGEAGPDVAPTLGASVGGDRGWDANPDRTALIAAPLTKGSAIGQGVNQPGRRQEDDVNLVAYALRKDPGGVGQGHNTNYIAGPLGGGNDGVGRRSEDDPNLVSVDFRNSTEDEVAMALQAGGMGTDRGRSINSIPHVAGASVRRLTPTECERLQALPDGWTDLGGTPDSRRYAALGDAVTSTVAEWIGRRLMEAG
jgi:DNA (cytosine-5)-methyltransferase 1